jgi:hypothetical protein
VLQLCAPCFVSRHAAAASLSALKTFVRLIVGVSGFLAVCTHALLVIYQGCQQSVINVITTKYGASAAVGACSTGRSVKQQFCFSRVQTFNCLMASQIASVWSHVCMRAWYIESKDRDDACACSHTRQQCQRIVDQACFDGGQAQHASTLPYNPWWYTSQVNTSRSR